MLCESHHPCTSRADGGRSFLAGDVRHADRKNGGDNNFEKGSKNNSIKYNAIGFPAADARDKFGPIDGGDSEVGTTLLGARRCSSKGAGVGEGGDGFGVVVTDGWAGTCEGGSAAARFACGRFHTLLLAQNRWTENQQINKVLIRPPYLFPPCLSYTAQHERQTNGCFGWASSATDAATGARQTSEFRLGTRQWQYAFRRSLFHAAIRPSPTSSMNRYMYCMEWVCLSSLPG